MEGRGREEREALCFLAQNAPVRVTQRDDTLVVTRDVHPLLTLRFDPADRRLVLFEGPSDTALAENGLSAAFEAAFGWEPSLSFLGLDLGSDGRLTAAACRDGLTLRTEHGLVARPEVTMQRRANWLPDASGPPYPFDPVMSGGKRHPRRPEKPTGLVYARHIPWLGQTVSFRALRLDDLPLFHRWMNDPRVDSFWNEAGDTAKHRAYLAGLIDDPHMLPLIGSYLQGYRDLARPQRHASVGHGGALARDCRFAASGGRGASTRRLRTTHRFDSGATRPIRAGAACRRDRGQPAPTTWRAGSGSRRRLLQGWPEQAATF